MKTQSWYPSLMAEYIKRNDSAKVGKACKHWASVSSSLKWAVRKQSLRSLKAPTSLSGTGPLSLPSPFQTHITHTPLTPAPSQRCTCSLGRLIPLFPIRGRKKGSRKLQALVPDLPTNAPSLSVAGIPDSLLEPRDILSQQPQEHRPTLGHRREGAGRQSLVLQSQPSPSTLFSPSPYSSRKLTEGSGNLQSVKRWGRCF